MPELDENVDLGKVRLNLNIRQPYYKYKLQIGVITDMDNPETSFVPVAVVNNSGKNMTNFECGFASVRDLVGAGRHIAFKNIGGSAHDLYCTNYLDDITLTYVEESECNITIADLPRIWTFENLTSNSGATGVEPECWEVIYEDAALESTTRPQLYKGYNTTTDGSYSLRMRNRCIYAMPALDQDIQVNNLTMTLNVRQPNSLYRLQVGLVDEEGTFTPGKTLNCSGTTSQPFMVNFRGHSSGRIAFRNILAPGTGMATDYLDYSYNYIDDIELKEVDCDGIVFDDNGEWYESFDNVCPNIHIPQTGMEPECWEMVHADVNLRYDKYPQVYYSSDVRYVHSDYYSLRLADRCVYAMPELPDGINWRDLIMKIWVFQPESFYELTVGIWEEPQGAEPHFVPVEVVTVSAEVMEEVTVIFSNYTGDGGRIAFRNTLSTGDSDDDSDDDLDYSYLNYSYNYIDDISFEYASYKISASEGGNVDEMDVERYLDNIVVYPNPTVGEFHIGATDVQKVECYNQMGQLVAVYNNENNINISSFAEGVYTLRITVPQGVTMRKVVKR